MGQGFLNKPYSFRDIKTGSLSFFAFAAQSADLLDLFVLCGCDQEKPPVFTCKS